MCRMDPDLLQEYIDGTIGTLEKVVLEEHLRVCPDCQRELNRLKIMDWDLGEFFEEKTALPPELSVLRATVLNRCLRDEREEATQRAGEDTGSFGMRDLLSIQLATFNNSLQFVGLMTGANREAKPVAPPTGK